eukprot:g46465.t1
MRRCSSIFWVASLWHWRRPRMDMSLREEEGELKWFAIGRCCRLSQRAQVLYKVVSEHPLGLTDVEATSGAVDAVDHIDGCAGEPLSDVKGLIGALNGGEWE